jgi:hypothetical protein
VLLITAVIMIQHILAAIVVEVVVTLLIR